MGRAKHCSAEKRQLIIKLKQEGKKIYSRDIKLFSYDD